MKESWALSEGKSWEKLQGSDGTFGLSTQTGYKLVQKEKVSNPSLFMYMTGAVLQAKNVLNTMTGVALETTISQGYKSIHGKRTAIFFLPPTLMGLSSAVFYHGVKN